ncbi:MAG: GTPase HflX [Oscillospiraceae bacterium]|nr:GTPase HflX [Oscillospiraceae bacterium]
MIELEKRAQRCLLVGVDTIEYDRESSLDELKMLCETAGGEVVGTTSQKRDVPDKVTCVGIGKLQEIALFCDVNEVDLVIFDIELSAVQLKNIENVISCAIIDRTMLILDIFAGRANTAEGKLQVELAQLKYRLPHLLGKGSAMSRLGGGIGTRGPGESKLESDRRHIHRRIDSLERELEKVEKRRETTRRARKENEVSTVALVGYTNVGKSTILNKLTGSDVLSKDMLFATLDPTTRSLTLENGQTVLLTDTVGFVSRLPHQLVSAFKSTLEEAVYADLILNVCDISSDDYENQLSVSKKLLLELGCDENKIITVYNKCDKLAGGIGVMMDDRSVVVSAHSGFGLDNLLKRIENELCSTVKLNLLFPYDKMDVIAKIRKNGSVVSQEYDENGVSVVAFVSKKEIYLVENYII